MQEIGKGLGNFDILIQRMAHHRGNQTSIQIHRKGNEINDLILSQMGWLPPSLDGIAMCQDSGVDNH